MPHEIFVLKDMERRETVSNIFRIVRLLSDSEEVDVYTLIDSLDYKKNSTMFNDALKQIASKISTPDSQLILSRPIDASHPQNLNRRFHGQKKEVHIFHLNKTVSYEVFRNLLQLMNKVLSNNLTERIDTVSDLKKISKSEQYGRLKPHRVLDIYGKSRPDIMAFFEYPYMGALVKRFESNIRSDIEKRFQFKNSNANWKGLFKEMTSSLPVLLFALFGTTPKIEALLKDANKSNEKMAELIHEVGDQIMRRKLEGYDFV